MNGIAKIKLFRYRKVYIRICRLMIISWQGLRYANGTFDPCDIECDVQEIRELLDDEFPTRWVWLYNR
jgi:hypothetical protein